MNRLKQLGKDSVIYGLGGIFGKALGFFLLPVYTRIFSPSEYGYIEMITIIGLLLGAVVNVGMDSGQSFYFHKVKDKGKEEQARIITSILQWKIMWGFFVIVVATLISPFINLWLFNGELDFSYFLVAFFGVLFGQVMRQSAEILRLLYRPWPYILLMIAQSIVAATLVISLVVLFDKGIFGYLLGSACASILVAVIGWVIVREYLDLSSLHIRTWPMLLRFGLPLLPASLSMYVMNTADRWFIQHYHGEQELGLYAVGAKFAILIAFVVETFRKAWWPIAMDSMHSDDGPRTYRMIARGYMGIGVAGIVYLSFLSPWLMKLMAAETYYEGYPIIGILAWQSLFYGFYLIASAGLWKTENTKYSAIFFAITAVLNILLNYLLVPKYGGIGAAVSSAVVFFIWIGISISISEKLWYIGFPIKVLLMQITIGVATVTGIIYSYLNGVEFINIIVVAHLVSLGLLLSALKLSELKRFGKKLLNYE